jgi:ankyrin repeat protein
VRALLKAGADVHKASDDGVTPLIAAAQHGHAAVVMALLEAGAAIDKADNDGRTSLFAAAQHEHEAVVLALLEAGAEVAALFAGRRWAKMNKQRTLIWGWAECDAAKGLNTTRVSHV